MRQSLSEKRCARSGIKSCRSKSIDNRMKRLGCLFMFLLAVALVAIVTCPGKDKHVDKIASTVSNVVDDETKGLGKFAISLIDGLTGKDIVKRSVDKVITVDDYSLLSLGKVEWQGKEHITSVGIFGMVFTMPEEMMKDKLRKAIEKLENR